MNDEIVDEVRRVREAYAAEFDFDFHRIAEDLRRRERESGREYLRLPPKKPAQPVVTVGEQ
jgi:hypothetical protein